MHERGRRRKTDEFGEDFNAKNTKNAKDGSNAFPASRSSPASRLIALIEWRDGIHHGVSQENGPKNESGQKIVSN